MKLKNNNIRDILFWTLFIGFGFIISVTLIMKNSSDELNIVDYGSVPYFELIDQNAMTISLADLNNKVWVIDFIFTTCAGPCPRMTEIMASIHNKLKAEDGVRFVSITVNPEYDSPQILKEYGNMYNANHEKWHFLTGKREAIHSLLVDGFHIGDKEDIVFHSTQFVLVDQNGTIIGYYSSTDREDIEKLEKDILQLL